jgi:hypothetical protein
MKRTVAGVFLKGLLTCARTPWLCLSVRVRQFYIFCRLLLRSMRACEREHTTCATVPGPRHRSNTTLSISRLLASRPPARATIKGPSCPRDRVRQLSHYLSKPHPRATSITCTHDTLRLQNAQAAVYISVSVSSVLYIYDIYYVYDIRRHDDDARVEVEASIQHAAAQQYILYYIHRL